MRETVARVFKCPVFDRYGSREMMDMACDCECHEGLHVNPVLQHIEILDEDDQPCPPGKLGRIIVTQLHNPVMPLIRYDTRDYAAWAEKPCSCGRNWPMIKQIDGRGISMFRFRNGGVITSFFLIYHIMKLFGEDHVRRSQIIQKDYNHYHIKLMLYNKEKWPDLEDERAAIKRVLADHIEEEARITYEILDEIPRTPSGKHLQAICEIDEEKDS
jgi:phenylacetate-CoA ligase